MWIKQRLRLSPTMYNSLRRFANFKADMYNVYIKARKDIVQTRTKLPFIAINDAIFSVLESWPPEWHAPNMEEKDRTTAQKQKDATKLRITQLAQQKHNKQAAVEVRVVHDATRVVA